MSSVWSLYPGHAHGHGHGLSSYAATAAAAAAAAGLSSPSAAAAAMAGGYGSLVNNNNGSTATGPPSSSFLAADDVSRLEPPYRAYGSDAIALYGSSTTPSSSSAYLSSMLSTPPPHHHALQPPFRNPVHASAWQTGSVDPVLASLKRSADEAFYGGDILSKRARVDSAAALSIYPQRPGEKDCSFYMRTRTCSFGASCKFDHPTWVPPGGIPDWKEVSAPATKITLPVRTGEPDCAFFMKTGICKFGSKCKFNHPQDQNTEGNVKVDITTDDAVAKAMGNGLEDADASVRPADAFNAKGLPLRPGETDCAFYMKTGSCKYGSTCRFNHPEKLPANITALNPPNFAAILGGLTGGLGTPPLFAGALPDYGLSLPLSSFGFPGIAQAPIYPQRPGETCCTFYMKNGICKFGANCKFHHPINRTEPSAIEASVKLTLAGLPRREGEQSCPYYMKTGTCKYGTSCKFDHPPPGEAAAKALADAVKPDQLDATDTEPIS